MGYGLNDRTKPHVRQAADFFGGRHNIADVGGWRARGSVPGSDHPKGLALDFMTRSRATGDALAADLIKNADAWNVKYVIWNRRIWQPGEGWSPYSGPSDHTDHVHASFKETPGKGAGGSSPPPKNVLDPLGVAGAIREVGERVGKIGEQVASVGKVADLLARAFLPTTWVRGSAALAGTLFVLIGIWLLSREIRNS